MNPNCTPHISTQRAQNRAIFRYLFQGATALAFVAFLSSCGSSQEPATVTPASGGSAETSAVPATAPVQTAREILTLANTAFRESRIVAPAGDNALEYTWRALQIEPDNAGATEILVDLTPIAASAVEAEIAAGRLPEAARIMNLLSAANPDSFTVKSLQQRLERTQALAAVVPTPTPLPAPVARSAEPPAQTVDRTDAQPTRSSEPASDPPASTARSAAATTVAPAAQRQTPAKSETPVARAAEAAPSPAALSQPKAAATTRTSVTSEPIPIQKFAPEYPAAARKRRTEGWVELQFMVGINGTPTQIEVMRAEPSGMFDRAAIRAVSRWKFKPAQREGSDVEAMARTTISFKLN